MMGGEWALKTDGRGMGIENHTRVSECSVPDVLTS